jgi:hypothetical protein
MPLSDGGKIVSFISVKPLLKRQLLFSTHELLSAQVEALACTEKTQQQVFPVRREHLFCLQAFPSAAAGSQAVWKTLSRFSFLAQPKALFSVLY